MNKLFHNQVTKKPRLCILFVIFLCSFVSLLLKGATVLIPLQTCGISPATNRNVILTPLQAMGGNAVPVMDKIQGTTDGSGNWSPALMPGVYQAQVRPAWGQVGVTEFYFYVDPSNAVQSAFTNLLTGTNLTWPPNQFAFSAQASDARYVSQSQYQSAVTNNETGVNLYGSFGGNGGGLTNMNASVFAGIPANLLLNPYATSWITNSFLEWWSADMLYTNNGSLVTNWIGRNGNVLAGNAMYSAQSINGHPAFYFDGTGRNIFTNGILLGNSCTNQCTVFCVFRFPRPTSLVYGVSPPATVFDGMTINGIYDGVFYIDYGKTAIMPAVFYSIVNGSLQVETQDVPNYHSTDDMRIYCITWSSSYLADFWDGKLDNYSPFGSSYDGTIPWSPIGFSGTLAIGQRANLIWPMTGYISEFLIYTNQLPFPVIDQINNYFLEKYGLLRNNITFFGDSMIWGANASWGGGWSDILSSNFPTWSIDNEGVPGATSSQCLSNVIVSAGTSTAVKKVAVIWNNLQNDESASLGTITNNQKQMGLILQSNGWLTLLVDPPSNYSTDTNQMGISSGEALRFAYQNWATNNWQYYFNGFIDLARDPYVGYSNACTNLFYWPIQPGEHWTNSGFAETAPYVIAAIHAVLDQNYFVNSTNAPPPTPGQPWWSQVATSPGHLFSNSNGVWMIR